MLPALTLALFCFFASFLENYAQFSDICKIVENINDKWFKGQKCSIRVIEELKSPEAVTTAWYVDVTQTDALANWRNENDYYDVIDVYRAILIKLEGRYRLLKLKTRYSYRYAAVKIGGFEFENKEHFVGRKFWEDDNGNLVDVDKYGHIIALSLNPSLLGGNDYLGQYVHIRDNIMIDFDTYEYTVMELRNSISPGSNIPEWSDGKSYGNNYLNSDIINEYASKALIRPFYYHLNVPYKNEYFMIWDVSRDQDKGWILVNRVGQVFERNSNDMPVEGRPFDGSRYLKYSAEEFIDTFNSPERRLKNKLEALVD